MGIVLRDTPDIWELEEIDEENNDTDHEENAQNDYKDESKFHMP